MVSLCAEPDRQLEMPDVAINKAIQFVQIKPGTPSPTSNVNLHIISEKRRIKQPRDSKDPYETVPYPPPALARMQAKEAKRNQKSKVKKTEKRDRVASCQVSVVSTERLKASGCRGEERKGEKGKWGNGEMEKGTDRKIESENETNGLVL